MDEDKCVVCGDIVPEGRMICYGCEHPIKPDFNKNNEENYNRLGAKN